MLEESIVLYVYKITNLINGKIYIGKHQTKDLDDGYMGSGKLLKRAIKKYGVENFKKEILVLCESKEEMDSKEKEFVEIGPHTYNLCEGGKGGFGYINKNGLNDAKKAFHCMMETMKQLYGINNVSQLPSVRETLRNNMLQRHKDGKMSAPPSWVGKHHSDLSKKKISLSKKGKGIGKKNSQYGTCWVSNETETKKIKMEDLDLWITKGYRRGRTYN